MQLKANDIAKPSNIAMLEDDHALEACNGRDATATVSSQPYNSGKEFEAARPFGAEERLKAIEARIERLPLHNLILAPPAP